MTSASPRPWRPLLDGPRADRARQIVAEIASALVERTGSVGDPTLSGRGGDAVFFDNLARAWNDERFELVAAQCLDEAVAELATASLSDGLHGGFLGIAWVVEHLQGSDCDRSEPDYNEAIDETLLALLTASRPQREFDLISGLAGHGVYALERLSRGRCRDCLEHVIARLSEQAVSRPDGIVWERRGERLDRVVDLGVAHGTPAVALVLAGACAAGVERERARPLLDGVASYLLANTLDHGPSAFRYSVCERDKGPARSAWCYGDPGVAAALLAAATAVSNAWWRDETVEIALRATRRPVDDCGVVDAGLCHGAAGLALIHGRLWQYTGDERFLVCAQQWCDVTMDLQRLGRGFAGYQSFLGQPSDNRTDDSRWRDDRRLLTGACGVGLALLAATSDIEPAWDRVLGLSLPSR